MFPEEDLRSLVSDLKTALSSSSLTALQRAQYKIQLQWLQDGSVPQAEYIAQSNGLIDPANATNYMCFIQGLLVSFVKAHADMSWLIIANRSIRLVEEAS